MKIEKRMYIRTIDGTIAKVTDNKDNVIVLTDDNTTHLRSKITKVSYDLIDLIEVGDYVNGEKAIGKKENEIVLGDFYNEIFYLGNEGIISIVTHEQFDNIKYEVK